MSVPPSPSFTCPISDGQSDIDQVTRDKMNVYQSQRQWPISMSFERSERGNWRPCQPWERQSRTPYQALHHPGPAGRQLDLVQDQQKTGIFCFFVFAVLGVEPRALHIESERSTTELQPQPKTRTLSRKTSGMFSGNKITSHYLIRTATE